MFGDQATRLILDEKNAQLTGAFRPYNDELVRLILLETRQLQTHISQLLASSPEADLSSQNKDPALSSQLLSHHLAAQRNKRCLLAYHENRLKTLKQRLWNHGGSLGLTLDSMADKTLSLSNSSTSNNNSRGGGGGGGEEELSITLRSRISPSELNFLKSYSNLITSYKSDLLDVLDLTAPLSGSSNPKSLLGNGNEDEENGFDFGPPTELMVTVLSLKDARDVQTERGGLNLRKGERLRVRREEVQSLITRGWLRVVDE